MTLEESMNGYLGGLSFSSREPHSHRLRLFLAHCEGKIKDIGQLKVEHLADYDRQMAEQGRFSHRTRYCRINGVRLWLRWATHQGHLSENPTAHWAPGCPSSRLSRPIPTPAQIKALLAAPPQDTLSGPTPAIQLNRMISDKDSR